MADHAPQFRPMDESDIPAVVALEYVSQLTPWTERNFRDALAAGNLGVVGISQSIVVAMAVLQMGAGEAELLTMAVLPAMRRCGLGRLLLDELILRVLNYGAEAIWLEVRVSNAPAIALYRSADFVDIGWRKGYYRTLTGREDAMMMRLVLGARRP
ncbi:MAG: ribosomal protein S18-alanine N-acetyltransferase [Casimicrobiaceae bacterium]